MIILTRRPVAGPDADSNPRTTRGSLARMAKRPATGASPRRANAPETTRGCIAIAPGEGAVRPLKTSEIVARDVVHDISTSGMQPGDSLPSETAMLEHYGVSRESLREGLRLLEVQGLIRIRRGPGGGPSVGTIDPANLGRTTALYYHLAGGTYRELFDAWVTAESLLADRAARNPDADLRAKRMEPYLDELGSQPSREAMEKFVETHTGFHGAIAALTDNRVLELLLQTPGMIATHHSTVNDDPRLLAEVIERDHAAIARAIVAGHARKARDLMEEHIERIADVYKTKLGAKVDEYIEWQ